MAISFANSRALPTARACCISTKGVHDRLEKVFSTSAVYDFPLTWKWDPPTKGVHDRLEKVFSTSAVYDPFSTGLRRPCNPK
jgi:hypothetical protein